MEAPLVHEVREARRLSEESFEAQKALAMIASALQSLDIVESQVRRQAEPEPPLPGADLVPRLKTLWPEHAEPTVEGLTYLGRVASRRAFLQGMRALLQPLADQAVERAQRLSDLQHRQQHELAAPRFAGLVAEMQAVGHERQDLAKMLAPTQQEEARIKPAANLLRMLIAQLDGALAERGSKDDRGLLPFRALHAASSSVQALAGLLAGVQLEVRLPEVAAPDPAPDATAASAQWSTVAGVRDALAELLTLLSARVDEVVETNQRTQRRYDELTQQIKDTLG